jgi:hypothetical protein
VLKVEVFPIFFVENALSDDIQALEIAIEHGSVYQSIIDR